MVDSSFSCCKRLKCVETFVTGRADVRELRAEQMAFDSLRGNSRGQFVNSKIPACRPGRFQGTMSAGGVLVCNSFFKAAFGVSNNLIQNRKNNPGASISKR
ncbi:unnamed protein product [Pylaiella littoralis]